MKSGIPIRRRAPGMRRRWAVGDTFAAYKPISLGVQKVTKAICFFTARYSVSGVPLAQLRLAKAFRERGYRVDFVFGYVPPGVDAPKSGGISIYDFGQPRAVNLLIPITRFIRDTRPDVIFSAEDHLNAVVAFATYLSGSRAKLSVSSRVTPYEAYSNVPFSKRWVLKQLSRLLWQRADVLTCVSKDMVGQYRNVFGQTRHRTIYNVIVDDDLHRKKNESVDHPWFADTDVPLIVSAGRLAPEKRFADVIAAVKIINDSRFARLVILGDGPLREELQALIDRLELADRAQLLGFQSNPLKYFQKARLFVLASCVEGLPNVLVEAMACGCPVVSTNCPTGPREVLKDGEFGELVPVGSPQALARAILRALETKPKADKLQEAVRPFTTDEVVARHLAALGLA
ncbi:glycosyltransferase [Methylosinus sporium]